MPSKVYFSLAMQIWYFIRNMTLPEEWTALALAEFVGLASTGKSSGFAFKSFSGSTLDSTGLESAFIFFRTGDSSREFFLFFSS